MIEIKGSPTADTRTCDYANVTEQTLLASSKQHINDVREGLRYFENLLCVAAVNHDWDKVVNIGEFHHDFVTGFKEHSWWDNHRKVNRHHLLQSDGVPSDVNLIDVLEMIVDCVMAGMARSGSVYPISIDPKVLMDAFNNTVAMLKSNVKVVGDES